MQVILHGNDDVMMDADKMMEKEIMEDKEKMDSKNKDMQTSDKKHKNKENKNTHNNMNRHKNRNMTKEDADNMIMDKGTKRKMKGKEIHKSSINEMSNMNHIVEVIEKNEVLGNAEFKDVNDEDERKTNLEKFEKSMVRKIKLSDRPKSMIEEERGSKSLSLDEDQQNIQLEKLTIEVLYDLKQKCSCFSTIVYSKQLGFARFFWYNLSRVILALGCNVNCESIDWLLGQKVSRSNIHQGQIV